MSRVKGSSGRALIVQCCMAPTHWDRRSDDADKLTLREAQWAYCPWNALAADGHDWMPTGGVLREVLDTLRTAPELPSR
jgi:hypothetical protein